MPEFPSETQDKIAALRVLYLAGTGIETYELVKVRWPAPTDPIWYSTSIPSEIAASLPIEVDPLEVRLLANSMPDWFLPVKMGDEIGDESVDLNFWDGPDDTGANNGAFGDLLFEYGEGIRAELYYWFPQVELLLFVWQGHLRNEDEADPPYLPIKAVQGFRSSESILPSGGHYEWCQAIFGGLLETQELIDEHGCPYNKHLGGSIGNNDPATGLPWTYCNRITHQSCIDRAVPPLYHLSHNTIASTVNNNQTKGNTLYSTTEGNQTNLPDPVCVVMGQRRVTGELLAWRRDLNNNNPDRGFFQTLNELCRGPIQQISQHRVEIGGDLHSTDPTHYTYRLGYFGQTANYLTTHGFSNIANFRQTSNWINPSTVGPGDVSSSAVVTGLNNIRVYSDEDTYTEAYTTNRVWQIARMLCDKIWGYGLDYSLLDIPAWIDAATWADEFVTFVDINGDSWTHQRTASNVELRGKKVQQQIEDMCRAGRLSRPFLFNGKIHIVPLRRHTLEEREAAPVFTDEGDAPNIVFEEDNGVERSTLRPGRRSSYDLPNRIEISYDKAVDDWKETPLRPVEDIDAQLSAGRAEGTTTRKIESKKFNLLGITDEPQAMKMAWGLLDLGEFDSGGLANNCNASFTAWYLDTLDLHPEKLIGILNTHLNTRYGFGYFRIKSMERESDLKVRIECQAYPVGYMNNDFELAFGEVEEPPDAPEFPQGPPAEPPPVPPEDLALPIVNFTADGFLEIY
jgi:hypothetical protein